MIINILYNILYYITIYLNFYIIYLTQKINLELRNFN